MGGNDTTSPAHGISIPSRPPVTPSQLNPAQTVMLVQALQTIKDSTQKIASDHRDLHSSVSKVNISWYFTNTYIEIHPTSPDIEGLLLTLPIFIP